MQVAKHLGCRPRLGLNGESETITFASLLLAKQATRRRFGRWLGLARFGIGSQAAARATYVLEPAPHPTIDADVHATRKRQEALDPHEYSSPLTVPFPAVHLVRSVCFHCYRIARPFSTDVCEPFWKKWRGIKIKKRISHRGHRGHGEDSSLIFSSSHLLIFSSSPCSP